MNLLGKKYGQWTVVDDSGKRLRSALQIDVQCECGTIKTYSKSIFVHGSSPDKCFKCHLKIQKATLMTSPRNK